MSDLSCKYMGFNVKSPIIIGSCDLTNKIEEVEKFAENGAGAIVLKSLFEEQIILDTAALDKKNTLNNNYFEGAEYLEYYVKQESINNYLSLITEAKKRTKIPIIASINCISADKWIEFAKRIEDAGADGLEINIFLLPLDPNKTGIEIENKYFEIIKSVMKVTKLPIAVKIGYHFSGLANFVQQLSYLKQVKAVILFNKFVSLDIDLDKQEIINASNFTSSNLSLAIRWSAILANKLDATLCATTGIKEGSDVIKCLLAGADAVQCVSTFYTNGSKKIIEIINDIKEWMNKNNYKSIEDFKGKLSHNNAKDPSIWERNQFVKYLLKK